MEKICDTIGIDFGNSTICASYFKDNKFQIFPLQTDRNLMPAYFTMKEKEFLVGREAVNTQKQKSTIFTLYDFRRMLCSDQFIFNDTPFKLCSNDLIEIETEKCDEKKNIPLVRIYAIFFFWIKRKMETELNFKFNNVVITMPIGLIISKQKLIVEAAQIACFNSINTIYEPIAASLAYMLAQGKLQTPKSICIFDLGGGKFNIANILISNNNVKLVKCDSRLRLGGRDFDEFLYEHIKLQECQQYSLEKKHHITIREKCNKAKESLTAQTETNITFEIGNNEISYDLNRKTFENLWEESFNTIFNLTKQFFKNNQEISDVVLIGGCTRIPRIQNELKKLIQECFPNVILLNKTINAEESVAKGAAIYAAMLSSVPFVKKINIDQTIPVDQELLINEKMENIVDDTHIVKKKVLNCIVSNICDIQMEKEEVKKLFKINDETHKNQESLQKSSSMVKLVDQEHKQQETYLKKELNEEPTNNKIPKNQEIIQKASSLVTDANDILTKFKKKYAEKFNDTSLFKRIEGMLKDFITNDLSYVIESNTLEIYKRIKPVINICFEIMNLIQTKEKTSNTHELEEFEKEANNYIELLTDPTKELQRYIDYFNGLKLWHEAEIALQKNRDSTRITGDVKYDTFINLQTENKKLKTYLEKFRIHGNPIEKNQYDAAASLLKQVMLN